MDPNRTSGACYWRLPGSSSQVYETCAPPGAWVTNVAWAISHSAYWLLFECVCPSPIRRGCLQQPD